MRIEDFEVILLEVAEIQRDGDLGIEFQVPTLKR